jgi:hypothetical protein
MLLVYIVIRQWRLVRQVLLRNLGNSTMYYPIVVLSHCCSSANVIEPREPHTYNNMNFIFYPPSTSVLFFIATDL